MAKKVLNFKSVNDVYLKLPKNRFKMLLSFINCFWPHLAGDPLWVKAFIKDILENTPEVIYRICKLYHPVYNAW